MGSSFASTLDWIDTQRDRMIDRVRRWCNINSGSTNLAGLAAMTDALDESFAGLSGHNRRITLTPAPTIDSHGQRRETPLGQAIHITNPCDAPLRVFLGIHMDTVYGPDHPFQVVEQVDTNTLRGPGVVDAKGGLAVMLTALEALERSGLSKKLCWEVLINPDEEIGSPGSAPLLAECAKRNHLGLVFEPTLPNGALVGARKGSGNFTVVVRGQAAHAGREFDKGRNAVVAMARLMTDLDDLNRSLNSTPDSSSGSDQGPAVTVNVGKIEGGGPVNIVPDLAICRFNVRITDAESIPRIQGRLEEMIASVNRLDGIQAELHGGITSPPKPMDAPITRLFDGVARCGQDLGIPICWQPSGGVCDGNKLAAAGLATVDTLGPRGGDLHSPSEYLLLDSLTERAKLTALLLMKLASGQLRWPLA